MNKEEREDAKRPVEVILVLPLGLEAGLFPWGIHSVKEYLKSTCDSMDLTVKVWDFRSDGFYSELNKRYSQTLGELFLSLNINQVDTFFKITENPYIFFGLAAFSGDDFFKHTGIGKSFHPSCSGDLNTLNSEVYGHIADEINEFTGNSPAVKRVWAFSVYDDTLFNSLHIACMIKHIDPGAKVVFGGDYFNFPAAKETFEGIKTINVLTEGKGVKIVKGETVAGTDYIRGDSIIDGIVVGYGEEVMRELVFQLSEGKPVSDLEIKGFLNRAYMSIYEEIGNKPHPLEEVYIPPLYKEFSEKPLVSYVQNTNAGESPGEIHILSQRGCNYGKCLFCTQLDKRLFFKIIDKEMFFPVVDKEFFLDIAEKEMASELENQEQLFKVIDKKMFFQVSIKDLVDGIQKKIIGSGDKRESIKISFDSDENDIAMISEFIKYLDNIELGGVQVEITLWLQVKSFRLVYAREIAKVKNKNINILFRLNFESLNVETLKNMKKGHLPLKSIEAAKVIQDIGHSTASNYFTHYPLEDRGGISVEIEFLRRILHLFRPPKGSGSFFAYSSNNRDALYREQEKFKIEVKRLPGDNWLKDVFGIDLPFSQWSHFYVEKPSFKMERLLIWSYYNSIRARDTVYRSQRIAESNWGISGMTFSRRIVHSRRVLKFHFWRLLHNSLQMFHIEKPYRKRTNLFLYLSKVMDAANREKNDAEDTLEGRFTKRSLLSDTTKGVLPSYFYIEAEKEENSGWILKKEYNAPGYSENWSISLEDGEIEVLRHFYLRRRREDGLKWLMENKNMAKVDVTETVNKHLELGSLIEYKHSLLCVVHDPGFWAENIDDR